MGCKSRPLLFSCFWYAFVVRGIRQAKNPTQEVIRFARSGARTSCVEICRSVTPHKRQRPCQKNRQEIHGDAAATKNQPQTLDWKTSRQNKTPPKTSVLDWLSQKKSEAVQGARIWIAKQSTGWRKKGKLRDPLPPNQKGGAGAAIDEACHCFGQGLETRLRPWRWIYSNKIPDSLLNKTNLNNDWPRASCGGQDIQTTRGSRKLLAITLLGQPVRADWHRRK